MCPALTEVPLVTRVAAAHINVRRRDRLPVGKLLRRPSPWTNTVKLLFPNTTDGTASVGLVEVVDPADDNRVVEINHVFASKGEDVTAQFYSFAKPSTCLSADDFSHKLGPGESSTILCVLDSSLASRTFEFQTRESPSTPGKTKSFRDSMSTSARR